MCRIRVEHPTASELRPCTAETTQRLEVAAYQEYLLRIVCNSVSERIDDAEHAHVVISRI